MKKLYEVHYQGSIEIEALDEESAKREVELYYNLPHDVILDVTQIPTCSESETK